MNDMSMASLAERWVPIHSNRVEFLFNLILFALDEASEMELDATAVLLDRASLSVQPFRQIASLEPDGRLP